MAGSDGGPIVNGSNLGSSAFTDCGSTAVVVVQDMASGLMWGANLGNSMAMLCASDPSGHAVAAGRPALVPHMLTSNHHPGVPQERRRIEAAGGWVSGGAGLKPRLADDLEISRAFGDFRYRSTGLSATPDILGPWSLFEAADCCDGATASGAPCPCCSPTIDSSGGSDNATQCSPCSGSQALLVMASDGLLEALTPQHVCDHAQAQLHGLPSPRLSPPAAAAIALGPVGIDPVPPVPAAWATAGLDAHTGMPDMPSSADAPSQGQGRRGLAAGAEQDPNLAGCCDCDLVAASDAMALGLDPCMEQALTRTNWKQARWCSAQGAAVRLVQEAVNQGSTDNVAVIVVQACLSHVANAASNSEQAHCFRGANSANAGTAHVGEASAHQSSSSAAHGPCASSSAQDLPPAQDHATLDTPLASTEGGSWADPDAADSGLLGTAAPGPSPFGMSFTGLPHGGNSVGGSALQLPWSGAGLPLAARFNQVIVVPEDGGYRGSRTARCAMVDAGAAQHGSAYKADAGSSRGSSAVSGNAAGPLRALAGGRCQDRHSYKLLERIAGVPSLPYHLHLQADSTDASHPWQLEQFMGTWASASGPPVPRLPDQQLRGSAALLLLLLGSLQQLSDAREPGASVEMVPRSCEALLDDIAAVPLQLALPDGSTGAGVTPSATEARADCRGSAVGALPDIPLPPGDAPAKPASLEASAVVPTLQAAIDVNGGMQHLLQPTMGMPGIGFDADPDSGVGLSSRRGRGLMGFSLDEADGSGFEHDPWVDDGADMDELQLLLPTQADVAQQTGGSGGGARAAGRAGSSIGGISGLQAHMQLLQPQAHRIGEDGTIHFVPPDSPVAAADPSLAHTYKLRDRFGQGHFGEVWKAQRTELLREAEAQAGFRDDSAEQATSSGSGGLPYEAYVLKRLRGERGAGVLLSGLREAYFGVLFQGLQGAMTVGPQEERLGYQHLVEFVESFEVAPLGPTPEGDKVGGHPGQGQGRHGSAPPPPDLWLVFKDAGASLHDLMYAPVGSEHFAAGDAGMDSGPSFQVLGPSAWYQAMRRHPQGHEYVRSMLRQLLMALNAVHSANVTHRDVKPENMLLTCGTPPGALSAHGPSGRAYGAGAPSPPVPVPHTDQGEEQPQPQEEHGGNHAETGHNGQGSADGAYSAPVRSKARLALGLCRNASDQDDGSVGPGWLRLIDFGSAVDGYSMTHLYGAEGPSADELTLEYAPPEALFGRYWEGSNAIKARSWTYDMWSVGVVWMELLLGTPQVWQLPSLTRALLEVKLALRGRPEGDRQLVFLLRGLMEWCIYPPQAPSPQAQAKDQHLRGRKARLLVGWSCAEEALLQLARARDPTGVGLEGPMALRLLQRLLHWEPASRPSAQQALAHAYFTVHPSAWSRHVCAQDMGHAGWC